MNWTVMVVGWIVIIGVVVGVAALCAWLEDRAGIPRHYYKEREK